MSDFTKRCSRCGQVMHVTEPQNFGASGPEHVTCPIQFKADTKVSYGRCFVPKPFVDKWEAIPEAKREELMQDLATFPERMESGSFINVHDPAAAAQMVFEYTKGNQGDSVLTLVAFDQLC